MTFEERAAKWRLLIEDQSSSGLSVKAWCNEHRHSASAYYRWRQYFRVSLEQSPSTFVLASGGNESCVLRVVLANQVSIEVPSDFDERLLRRVVSVLTSTCG